MRTRLPRWALVLFFMFAAAAFGDDRKPLPWLGLAFTWSETPKDRRMLHVRSVTAGGPAERAGVRTGDLVATINGERVDFGDELEFLLFLAERKPGERLRTALVRNGQPLGIVITLGTLAEENRWKWERNLEMAKRNREARERRGKTDQE